MKLDQKTLFQARRALQEAVSDWIYDPNVRLIDLGWPLHHGSLAKDELAIRFHVMEKLKGPALEVATAMGVTRARIPDTIGGFPTDVPQRIYRLQDLSGGGWRPSSLLRSSRFDPMKCGISISNVYQDIYGTLGGLVSDRVTGDKMILSNWHVLVGEWGARPPTCQPGTGDGGDYDCIVASYSRDAMSAHFDAAVAKLEDRELVNEQYELGPVRGVGWAQIGTQVVKSGRRTGVTYGQVTAIEGTLRLTYAGVDRLIENVMTIAPRPSHEPVVSDAGDSGSLWLEESTLKAVGLHFAGSDDPEIALAMDIQPVLDALNVNLMF